MKLAEAVHEVLAARQSEPQSLQFALPKSPQAALEQATQVYLQNQSTPKVLSPSFEELFKAAAQADLASV